MAEQKSRLMTKHYEALKDYIGKGFVFKKCVGITRIYKCIVILKKPSENFKCNEDRENVKDKNFAKFRCNGLVTVAIYDLYTEQFRNFLDHSFIAGNNSHKIIYHVDLLSIPHEYNEDINLVCTSGIHYFLHLEAALNYVDGRVQAVFKDKVLIYDKNGKQDETLFLNAKIY